MLGLSIDGPGSLTAEPVPLDITLNPAFLREQRVSAAAALNARYDARQDIVRFH